MINSSDVCKVTYLMGSMQLANRVHSGVKHGSGHWHCRFSFLQRNATQRKQTTDNTNIVTSTYDIHLKKRRPNNWLTQKGVWFTEVASVFLQCNICTWQLRRRSRSGISIHWIFQQNSKDSFFFFFSFPLKLTLYKLNIWISLIKQSALQYTECRCCSN